MKHKLLVYTTKGGRVNRKCYWKCWCYWQSICFLLKEWNVRKRMKSDKQLVNRDLVVSSCRHCPATQLWGDAGTRWLYVLMGVSPLLHRYTVPRFTSIIRQVWGSWRGAKGGKPSGSILKWCYTHYNTGRKMWLLSTLRNLTFSGIWRQGCLIQIIWARHTYIIYLKTH